jgi:hypothetical protein
MASAAGGGGGGGGAAGGGGVFSTFDPLPTSRMRHICFFTICGHGEKLVVENTPQLRQVVAEENEQISRLWPPGLNLTVSSVIPMVSFAPGISQTLKNEIPTNFSSHLPGMTMVVRDIKASLERGASKDKLEKPVNLIPFGEAIMAEIREIDRGAGLNYQEEASSIPGLVSKSDFYQTSVTTKKDYTARNNRVVWVRPNEGEGRRPGSNQPMRVVSDGDDVFPFYGVFVIMVIGGILPQACTLTRMHEELILPHVLSHKYTKYNPEVVRRYNLVARENRVDVETKIAIHMGFLSKISGILSHPTPHDAAAWDAYKSDLNGAIQILRRAIVYKHISQIEASILLHALGYTDLLLVDSACNCPGDREPTEQFIDSQDADVLGITDAEARCWDSRADPAAAEAGARAGGEFDLQIRRMHASVRHGRRQHTVPLSDQNMANFDSSAAAADMGGRWGGGSKRKKSRKRLLSKNRKRQKCRRTRRKRYTRRRR